MSKQKLNKLISVLLALAICSATVFGCLITVNAAEEPSCKIANGVVSGDSKTATVDVTFTAPGGISAGEFAVDANEQYFTGVTAKVIAGTPLNPETDGAFGAADFTITHTGDLGGETDLKGALEVILFETKKVITGTDKDGNEIGHLKPYTSVTFQLTYTLVDGAVVKGTIPVSISDIEITDQNGGQINISAKTAKGTIETGCDHIITVSGAPIRTDAANGYAVYENGVCSLCGKNFGYQVVPTAEATATTESIIYNDTPITDFMTNAAKGVGDTPDNPYIIKTVGELIYLVRQANRDDTIGKYFQIDKDIDTIVLQSSDSLKAIGTYFSETNTPEAGLEALKNMTAAQAEEYYGVNNGTTNGSNWWGQDNKSAAGDLAGIFAGTIDFNGATVYGLKARSGGLFQYAGSNATFKNLTIKGSYITGEYAGAIVSTNRYGNSTENYKITFENCVVADSTIVCTRGNGVSNCGGVLAGDMGWNKTILNINNCLVYGNTAKHSGTGDGFTDYAITYGLFGNAGEHTLTDEGGNKIYTRSKIQNSIILDCVPHAVSNNWSTTYHLTYNNVYTNMAGKTITNIDHIKSGSEYYKVTYTLNTEIINDNEYKFNVYGTKEDGTAYGGNIVYTGGNGKIKAVTNANIKGANANNIISNFDDSWAYTVDGYPTPLAAYADAVSTEASRDFALEAVNLTYEDSGNFSINFHYEPPYAGFAPTLYVAKATENGKFRTLTATRSSEAGKGLSANAVMYTLTGLSATEIGDTLLATVIDGQNAIKCWGKTEQISIKDYAISVISGEGVYTDGATDDQKQADKDVAAAVINYGEAAKGINNDYATPTKTRIEYWDGTTITAPELEVGSENVYIINSAANLAYIAKNENNDTSGKTYKVANDIKAIVLQPKGEIANAIMNLSSATEVKAYFEDENNKSSLKNWVYLDTRDEKGDRGRVYDNGFAGTFDGNGATIYGLYCKNSWPNATGLFPSANGMTVQNVAIKNCYVYGDDAAVLCGKSTATGRFIVNDCEVANNVAITNRQNWVTGYCGVLVGYCTSSKIAVDGCLVYGNSVKSEKYSDQNYSLCGSLSSTDDSTYSSISNSIILDAAPYSFTTGYISWNAKYTNIYSNMQTGAIVYKDNNNNDVGIVYDINCVVVDNKVTTMVLKKTEGTTVTGPYTVSDLRIPLITASDIKGANAKTNCPNFDWSNWTYGLTGNYPTFANADINALYDTEGTTLYWDGSTYTEPTTKDAKGNYIIDTAAKLAYLACKTKDKTYETHGKTYKVADGITAIVLQPESLKDIKDKTSAAEVKAFFDKNAGAAKKWNVVGYNGQYPFQGTFDGNGATIYGLYSNGSGAYHGLFGLVDQGATFKNITVKNSYMVETGGGFMGAIFANTAKPTNDPNSTWNATDKIGTGDIVVENCVSANNYMNAPSDSYNNRNKFGVLVGASSYDYLKMNNCIAYGNDATTGITTPDSATFDIPFIGGLNGDTVDEKGVNSVANIISLGATPYNRYDFGWGSYVHYEGKNTGTNCFKNVYTDQPVGYFNMYAGVTTKAYTDFASKAMPNLTSVNANDLIGDKGATIVDALNIANGGKTVWYTGWGYPGFKEASIMPDANQSAYNALSLKVSDNYGASTSEFGMYGTSLSLKANPYIGFTFAFSGDYKANRKDITVTFTTASGKVINTKVANDDGKLNPGWTNKEGAGRYHLYKLTDVPAKDLCSPISVSVKYGEADAVNFGSFSAEGFALDAASAYNQNPCAYYSTRYEAAKALLFYSQMLDARYGEHK